MVAGAALVGIGLAFPGPISIGNIPIITNNGQPAIQVVIGSAAKASDGVAAANIAAAIGNLAFTTSTVSPVVNTTEAQSVLHVSVSSPTYSLTNQQVWLNESASALTSGTYGFTALIGSVLNGGVQLGSLTSTKTLSSSTSYTYGESTLLTTTPAPSPYTAVTYVPVGTSVSASYNGGGVSFSSFTLSSQDNLLEVSHANLPALLSGSGTNGENEYLWLTGFPVFDQASGVNNFALLDANGAYQVTFNKPIPVNVSNSINNAAFTFLGQQWTIIGYKLPGASAWNYTTPKSKSIEESAASTFTSGGYLQLAATTTPLRTVDVGSNMTSGPWTVALKDIGQATGGSYPAIVEVYYNGAPVQNYSIIPPKTISVNESGNRLFIHVNQTVAGFYAYEKWAQMQLYSNVETLQSGAVLNSTTNPNWNVVLQWTNSSEAASSPLDSLQSIIVYGTTSQAETLLPGQSFNFITSPAVWKLEFVGETLGSANFDALTAKTSAQGAFKYTNPSSTLSGSGTGIYNVTEPAQELTITSQIPNAFTYQGQTSSSITYDLTPYEVNNNANTLTGSPHPLNTVANGFPFNSVVTATFPANYITASATLQLQVTGYEANTGSGAATSIQQSPTFTFNGASGATTQSFNIPIPFYNVSSIAITNNHAIPGLTVNVITQNAATTNSVDLADLVEVSSSPYIVYTPSGKTIPSLASPGTINYNQQNGQTPEPFTISGSPVTQTYTGSSVAPSAWYEYTMKELAVPTNSLAVDSLSFDIVNSTGGATASPFFQLNYSGTASGSKGTQNNMTYQPSNTSMAVFNVNAGFRTEKGSKIASITPTTLTVDFAKTTDMLQFAVAPVSTTVSKSFSLQGPYGIGQATNIPNVSIGKVTANITLSGTSGYTITGISNITANPVTTSTPVLLKSLSSTAPLAILDSQGVQNSPYILVGSGYVNSLSAALQSAYNITMSPSTQIVQAYGNRILVAGYYANETTAAANQFINELYQQAASTT